MELNKNYQNLKEGSSKNGVDKITKIKKKNNKAFVVYMFNNLLENTDSELKHEVEKLKFNKKCSDLFSLSQSEDFESFSHESQLGKLRNLFHWDVRKFLETVLQIKLDGHLSMSASKYVSTDYLLCHDDRCDDRHIAFIYYLDDNWREEYGGLFEVFDHDKFLKPTHVVNSIVPKFNTLLCFEVSPVSYHQVSEVTAERRARFAISGWFHSSEALKDKNSLPEEALSSNTQTIPLMYSTVHEMSCLNYGEGYYLKNAPDMRASFRAQRCLLLDNFLQNDFFNDVAADLKSVEIEWELVGPPNKRSYEIAKHTNESSLRLKNTLALNALLELCETTVFIEFLTNCTGGIYLKGKAESVTPEVGIELQRWRKGFYKLMDVTEGVEYEESLDVWIFFNVGPVTDNDNRIGGLINYVHNSSTKSNKYEGDEVIHFVPKDNSLSVVYRYEGMFPFVSMLNHRMGNDIYHSLHLQYFFKEE